MKYGHEVGNEMDVSAQAIELGNRDGAFALTAGLGERGGELGAAVDRAGVSTAGLRPPFSRCSPICEWC